ncbi:putative signal peptide protein [Puccinia sorghi]|uniref:Putative signal peptide protein n=1 Tax=Puccinia sorghi TaxID=27349 RepID=A0A0L6UTL6_9BASI|nr:putative signal peptide protein [Puccinia sorghi]
MAFSRFLESIVCLLRGFVACLPNLKLEPQTPGVRGVTGVSPVF